MTRLFDRSKKAGFTLVELIVVIAIIGILAGISVPVYNHYIFKAHKAGDLTLLAATNKSFASACLENGFDAADVLYSELEIENGCIVGIKTLTLKNGVTPRLLKAGPAADGIVFSTLSAGPRKNYQVVTLSSMAEVIDSMNTSFTKYYGDNKQTPLQYYTEEDIGFGGGVFGVAEDMDVIASSLNNGAVVTATKNTSAGTTTYAMTTADGKEMAFTVADSDTSAVANSTFGNSEVMTMKNLMDEVNGVVTFAGGLLGGGGNAAGLLNMVTSDPDFEAFVSKNFDTEELMSKYEKMGEDEKKAAAMNTLVMYAASKTTEESAVGVRDALVKVFSEAEEGNGNVGLRDLLDACAVQNESEEMDIGGTIANLATVYGYVTAYSHENGKSTSNPVAAMNAAISDKGFKAYMNSDASSVDALGYAGAMSMISDNVAQLGTEALTNGFADENLVTILSSVFGQDATTASEENG